MPRFGTVRRLIPMLALTGFLLCTTLSIPAVAVEPRHCIPAKGLVAYVEYEGLDAHADAWQKTAAHDLLYKTPTGPMLVKLFQQLADPMIKDDTDGELDASRVLETADLLVRQGFAYALYADSEVRLGCVLVVKGYGRTPLARKLPLSELEGDVCRVRGREVNQWLYEDSDTAAFRPNPLYVDAPPGSSSERSPNAFIGVDAFWLEGDDLIFVNAEWGINEQPAAGMDRQVGCPDSLAVVLDTIEGKELNITTHEGFRSAVAEGNDLKGFEPNGMFFAEIRPDLQGPATLMLLALDLTFAPLIYALDDSPLAPDDPNMRSTAMKLIDDEVARASVESANTKPGSKPEPMKTAVVEAEEFGGPLVNESECEVAQELGFNGVKRIIARWGFQDRALLSTVRIEAPSPRPGLFTLFDQPAFQTDRLPTIPRDASSFVLASFAPEAFYRKLLETARKVDPDDTQEFDALEEMIPLWLGLRLREDLLRHIGPTWAVVDLPAKDHGTSTVLVMTVDDPNALDKVLGKLAHHLDVAIGSYLDAERKKAAKGMEIGSFGLTRLPAPDRGYRIDLPSVHFDFDADDNPVALDLKKSQTWSVYLLIGKSSVALATGLEPARHVLLAETGAWKPSGVLTTAFDGLPTSLTYLSVTDPARCTLPNLIANIPMTTRMILGGMALEEDAEEKPLLSCLEFFGLVTQPGQPTIRLAPSETPKAEDVQQLVFPSILATSVDDRGYRILHRQPFPLAGLLSELAFGQKWSLEWQMTRKPELNVKAGVTSPRFSIRRR